MEFGDIVEIVSKQHNAGFEVRNSAVLNADTEGGLTQTHNNRQTSQLYQRHVFGHTDCTEDLPILTAHYNFHFIHLYHTNICQHTGKIIH